jgi:hypothetical protein
MHLLLAKAIAAELCQTVSGMIARELAYMEVFTACLTQRQR